MAETQQQPHRRPAEGIKSLLPEKALSTSHVVAVAALFPAGGILLVLSGVTLTGTVIALAIAIATPVFVVFSPVIVPAAIAIGLAVLGFLASGAFGLTAVSFLTYVLNCLKNMQTRVQETAGQVGRRTKEIEQAVQRRRGGDVSRGPVHTAEVATVVE